MSTADSILDLESGADHSAIRAAWKRAARRWHPDRPQGDAQRFIAAQKAYELLMQWSARRPIHDFSPNPCKPIWFRVLNGLALPLSGVTLFLAVPMVVLGQSRHSFISLSARKSNRTLAGWSRWLAVLSGRLGLG